MQSRTIEILKEAKKNKRAVGAFNFTGLEVLQGIVSGAEELAMPCVVQMTKSTSDHLGASVAGRMVEAVIDQDNGKVPIGFHLDHGKSFDEIMKAIEIGCDSVMIDASRLNFKDNLALTKKVVDYAHKRGVSVQAELGNVPYLGMEDQSINWDSVMTNPEEARQLVAETGIDALAVGIGNAHGFFRERSEPDWERLEKINNLIPNTPLVLHGASDWNGDRVKMAIERGVSCFNVDTDLRIAVISVFCQNFGKKCEITDPRKIFAQVREAVKKKVKEKIKMFHNN